MGGISRNWETSILTDNIVVRVRCSSFEHCGSEGPPDCEMVAYSVIRGHGSRSTLSRNEPLGSDNDQIALMAKGTPSRPPSVMDSH